MVENSLPSPWFRWVFHSATDKNKQLKSQSVDGSDSVMPSVARQSTSPEVGDLFVSQPSQWQAAIGYSDPLCCDGLTALTSLFF